MRPNREVGEDDELSHNHGDHTDSQQMPQQPPRRLCGDLILVEKRWNRHG